MMIIETQRKLAQVFNQAQATLLAEVIEESYRDLVKIGDFNELKAVVKELSTEVKGLSTEVKELSTEVKELSVEMKSLAEQQKQTSAEVKELAEQQKQTSAEVKGLSIEMKSLAEQQKQTSAKVEELAEQQKLTSIAVAELSEQQKKAWLAIESLAQEGKKTRKEVGGLATTVGYRLEDESYKALPRLLQQDFDMQVVGNIKRGYLQSKEGQPLEINILGKAKQQEKEFLLIGEAKSQLSKKFVDEFIRKKLNHVTADLPIFPLLVTYMITTPDVENYVHEKGIALYYSFNF